MCHKIGHLKQNCPLWKKHGEKSGKKSMSIVANLGLEEDLMVVLDAHQKAQERWILDSACLHHYTLHRSLFLDYVKTDEESVTLWDDHPCRVIGFNSIRVRMFDGTV